MSMTQEQELAALRAELERLRADQSKAIEKLAELIGERNDLQAKLSLVNLKRYQKCGCVVCICEDDEKCHGCGAKNCNKESCVFKSNSAEYKEHPTLSDLQAKLATVEADCAAMRDVCQQVFNDHFPTEADTRCRQCHWKLKDALEDGSGQRLLDELAALRETVNAYSAERQKLREILLDGSDWERGDLIDFATKLRETAQRRLGLITRIEWIEGKCPWCHAYACDGHTTGCARAAELATVKAERDRFWQCIKDDCDNEQAARVEARKVLTPVEVDGDSHGVPTVADIVERLVIEVAHLRGMAQHMVACRALLNVPNNEVLHQAIQDLRETAQRRLDWLKKYESGERLTCPECGGIVSAPQRHTPDCRLGKDVATEDAK